MRRMVITCPTAWNFRRKLFVPTWRLCIDGSGTTSRCNVYHKVILLHTFYPFPASSCARGRRLASDYFVLMFQGQVTDTINYCFSKRKRKIIYLKTFFLNCLKRVPNWNITPTTGTYVLCEQTWSSILCLVSAPDVVGDFLLHFGVWLWADL